MKDCGIEVEILFCSFIGEQKRLQRIARLNAKQRFEAHSPQPKILHKNYKPPSQPFVKILISIFLAIAAYFSIILQPK